MIKKIGVDIVSNERIKTLILNEKVVKRLLSTSELSIFDSITLEKRKVEFLAGRFTAKEALAKAIGKTNGEVCYTDISVLNEDDGTPIIKSTLFNERIHLSISHCDEYTVSMVIIEAETNI